MAKSTLKEVLRSIDVVLTDKRVGPGQRDQLLKARRELVRFAKSGKVGKHRLLLAAKLIADVLLEIVKREAGPRPR
jgi:hypothetical protein